MRTRITTRKQYREHIKRCFHEMDNQGRELAGDIAAVNSNWVHNPRTGHHEFPADTPAWVVRIAKRRKWISTVGNMQWE